MSRAHPGGEQAESRRGEAVRRRAEVRDAAFRAQTLMSESKRQASQPHSASADDEDAERRDADIDEASDDSFPASDPPSYAGGSGTAGPATEEKEQAGSYARDAEQDPGRERHRRADSDR